MRSAMRATIVVTMVSLLVGCNGMVKSRILTPEQLSVEFSRPEGARGVLGYYEKSVIEIDELRGLVDKDGKPIAGLCNPLQVQKISTYADQDHPFEIWYEPGLLEANQFSVQMTNSVFTAVNSQSTPDQGKTLANLATAGTSFAKLGAAAPAAAAPRAPPSPTLPDCNGNPYFVGMRALHLP